MNPIRSLGRKGLNSGAVRQESILKAHSGRADGQLLLEPLELRTLLSVGVDFATALPQAVQGTMPLTVESTPADAHNQIVLNYAGTTDLKRSDIAATAATHFLAFCGLMRPPERRCRRESWRWMITITVCPITPVRSL